ncbi:hypothetical protein [Polyangium mundeleinium]|uniref:Uncharacterized protein n=1 Tax=Polyangium mundeleinium TaxID=2995306 RepID=A0ABT5EX99_9BACT|nr:hypothetical protein [Polyangium mundeleinium]MDC0745450.1 hypothetical protein [Polyangium mundeleinium]
MTINASGALSVLRIYLPRRTVKRGRGFWGVADLSDTPPNTLPSCVKLIGTHDILDAFVTTHHEDHRGTVIVRLDGVAMSGGPS